MKVGFELDSICLYAFVMLHAESKLLQWITYQPGWMHSFLTQKQNIPFECTVLTKSAVPVSRSAQFGGT